VVDPAADQQVGQQERGVEVPDAAPEERLAGEQQQTDGVVVDEQQRNVETPLGPAGVRLTLLSFQLITLYSPSYLCAPDKAHLSATGRSSPPLQLALKRNWV